MQGILDKIGRTVVELKKLKQPHGMTLVEIMIVVTIMASIAGVVGVFVFGALDRSNIREAEIQMNNLQQSIETYATDNNGQLPDSLGELTQGSYPYMEEIPEDPWGNDYSYEVQGRHDYELCSAGPDGTPNTEEDVCLND